MKIGIISDTHDNIENLKKVLNEFKLRNIEMIIHCGDLVSPFMFKELAKFNGEVHVVFGYQDVGSLVNLVKENKSIKDLNLVIHDEFGELVVEKKKIIFIHNNELAELLAETGSYDVVFHGHNHKANVRKIKNTILVNPGELSNIIAKPSFAIYDTESDKIEIIELK